ncbi:Collagenase [Aureococcus anophagefferens]|uniref:Collagenase n=1 Tax=Aureococcus anophagefferens TaxID=44056 RepID=A0ABR1FXD6_AURAN
MFDIEADGQGGGLYGRDGGGDAGNYRNAQDAKKAAESYMLDHPELFDEEERMDAARFLCWPRRCAYMARVCRGRWGGVNVNIAMMLKKGANAVADGDGDDADGDDGAGAGGDYRGDDGDDGAARAPGVAEGAYERQTLFMAALRADKKGALLSSLFSFYVKKDRAVDPPVDRAPAHPRSGRADAKFRSGRDGCAKVQFRGLVDIEPPVSRAGRGALLPRLGRVHRRAGAVDENPVKKAPRPPGTNVLRRKNPDLFDAASPDATPAAALRKPEVMAPAGGWPQLRAAVANGADAACRLPHEVLVDGAGDQADGAATLNYALSPQDLCGLEDVEALTKAGVHCLKIEGRLKGERYVSGDDARVREAVDAAWAKLRGDDADATPTVSRSDLAQVFSRGQSGDADGLSAGFLRASGTRALGQLGDTPWAPASVDINLGGGAWWCRAADVRRHGAARAAALGARRRRAPARAGAAGAARALLERGDGSLLDDGFDESLLEFKVGVAVLVRDLDQCAAAVDYALTTPPSDDFSVDEVVLDFLELKGLREAVAAIRERAPGLNVVVAAPRISLPGEDGALEKLLALGPDALLARSPGQLRYFAGRDVELRGDFSLNAANALTANDLFDDAAALTRLTPAHDLGGAAVARLARRLTPSRRAKLEAVAHQHLPIFHASHCLYARHLSKGDSFENCGHVCERHTIHLRDEAGADHVVLADMGCRNTVFNAQAQSAADALGSWLDAGISRYRVEFVDESPAAVAAVLGAYRDLFLSRGELPEPLWSLLADVPDANGAPQGAGVGSLKDGERKSGKARKTTGQHRAHYK